MPFRLSFTSIDATLVREGLARAWTRDGQHRDTLVELERDARGSGAGSTLDHVFTEISTFIRMCLKAKMGWETTEEDVDEEWLIQ